MHRLFPRLMALSSVSALVPVLVPAALSIATFAAAQPAPPLLVSPAWVAERLTAPDVVILHVGSEVGYRAGHLPGARLALASQFSETASDARGNPLALQMPGAEALRAGLAALGISDGSTVVVYAQAPQSMNMATRLMVTLQYAGLENRSVLLQGGLPAWTAAGQATTTTPGPTTSGTLGPLTLQPVVVDGDWIEARLSTPGIRIVDARTPDFYSGARTGGGAENPHKTGHITGAVNIPFSSTWDADGFKSLDELRRVFSEAGVRTGEIVVTYCHIGQQATATLFAARLLGYDVRLYDGSFEDWSRRLNAPVTVK